MGYLAEIGAQSLAHQEVRVCDDCGEPTVTQHREQQSFTYGEGRDAVVLSVNIPVWKCAACESAYTEEEAEIIRHQAVCQHLGVLTPQEITIIRGSLSRKAFSDLTGIGEASLKRWESGEIIQNRAMDMLLRVSGDAVGRLRMNAIRQHADIQRKNYARARFQTEFPESVLAQSETFNLREAS